MKKIKILRKKKSAPWIILQSCPRGKLERDHGDPSAVKMESHRKASRIIG